jgi:chemotaxis protein MotA
VELAGIARKDGMIALESEEIPNRFLAKGISSLVDGNEASFIRSSLERDMYMTARRHEAGRGTLQAAGDIAPSMGMIGTLIGLVNLLQNMASNPEGIGPAMALALLTTLYGSLLANIVFIPIAMKLENHAKNEEMNSQLIIEGVLFIQGGGNPRLLGDLLSAFLNPKKNKKRANAEPAAG